MEISKTDIKIIIRFLDESAILFSNAGCSVYPRASPRLQNRARLMRLMTNKLSNKLKKEQNNDKTTTR